jgi:hypothetical protein
MTLTTILLVLLILIVLGGGRYICNGAYREESFSLVTVLFVAAVALLLIRGYF